MGRGHELGAGRVLYLDALLELGVNAIDTGIDDRDQRRSAGSFAVQAPRAGALRPVGEPCVGVAVVTDHRAGAVHVFPLRPLHAAVLAETQQRAGQVAAGGEERQCLTGSREFDLPQQRETVLRRHCGGRAGIHQRNHDAGQKGWLDGIERHADRRAAGGELELVVGTVRRQVGRADVRTTGGIERFVQIHFVGALPAATR